MGVTLNVGEIFGGSTPLSDRGLPTVTVTALIGVGIEENPLTAVLPVMFPVNMVGKEFINVGFIAWCDLMRFSIASGILTGLGEISAPVFAGSLELRSSASFVGEPLFEPLSNRCESICFLKLSVLVNVNPHTSQLGRGCPGGMAMPLGAHSRICLESSLGSLKHSPHIEHFFGSLIIWFIIDPKTGHWPGWCLLMCTFSCPFCLCPLPQIMHL